MLSASTDTLFSNQHLARDNEASVESLFEYPQLSLSFQKLQSGQLCPRKSV
jgi:hypothetical protein